MFQAPCVQEGVVGVTDKFLVVSSSTCYVCDLDFNQRYVSELLVLYHTTMQSQLTVCDIYNGFNV